MARIDAIVDRIHSYPGRGRGVGNDRGHHAAPRRDVLMEQILENLHTTSPEQVFQRIASLSNVRRGKVLDIRRQLAEGTYAVADRLDRAMDRVLEAITT